MRHPDMEMTVIKEEVCYTHKSLDTGFVAGYAGEAPG
jgi:hypothetical protein